jgi:UDP-glucuronate decarboxylase
LPQDDPKQRQPDIGLAKKMTGWQPKVDLVDGLKETVAYFVRLSNQPLNIKKATVFSFQK